MDVPLLIFQPQFAHSICESVHCSASDSGTACGDISISFACRLVCSCRFDRAFWLYVMLVFDVIEDVIDARNANSRFECL